MARILSTLGRPGRREGRGPGVRMGGGGGSMGAGGSTPVIISCPCSSGAAGEANVTGVPCEGTSGVFGEREGWWCFLGASQKDPGLGPSPSRISKIKTNITFFPLAMGQRGGSSTQAHCTRCV